MKTITINSPTYGIKEIFVDDEDFENVNKYKWCIYKSRNTFYAQCWELNQISLHRFILKLTDPKIFGDHEDFNGLNNQKYNLRICSISQNNAHKKAVGKSKYLGVSLKIDNRKRKDTSLPIKSTWHASLRFNKKITYLGSFKNEIEAAKAYDIAALQVHGIFANLNFK